MTVPSDGAESDRRTEQLTCPFEGCEWEHNYNPDSPWGREDAESHAELHYERDHAGKVRIQVTLEREQLLGERDPEDIRERVMNDFEEKSSYDVAFVRTEVLEEADDHSRTVPREDTSK
jgi:hypothetical protein